MDLASAAIPQRRQEATRRGFLKSAVAFGGLVATSRLPVFADDVSLFRGRGMFERLSLVSRHIDAGAERPFSVLHISDTHLTAAYPHESEWTRSFMEKRVRVFGGWQEEALRNSLSWAKGHVDYVVHTGDLIDGQSEANFDLVRKYYGEGGASMFGSLGNHEYYHGQKVENEETKSETRDRLAAAYPFDISFQSTVVNGVNFVTLDDVYNAVTADQAGKFDAEVKKGLPIVLCMHCPFGSPRHSRCPTIPPPTRSGPSPVTRSYSCGAEEAGMKGWRGRRGGYLRKTWRNRGKNEVRPGALSPQILFFQLHLILSQIPSADAILPDHGPR